MSERMERLAGYQSRLAKMERQSKDHAKFSSSLELKEHELHLLEERSAQSLHALRIGQLGEQEVELEAARKEAGECEKRGQEAARKHKQLQEQEEGLRKKREVSIHGSSNETLWSVCLMLKCWAV